MHKIPGDVAQELFDIEDGKTTTSNYKRVEDVHIDSGRWTEHHWLVFLDPKDNHTYAYSYDVGLTEYQDNSYPWSRSGDYSTYGEDFLDVDVFPVVGQIVQTTAWDRVKEETT